MQTRTGLVCVGGGGTHVGRSAALELDREELEPGPAAAVLAIREVRLLEPAGHPAHQLKRGGGKRAGTCSVVDVERGPEQLAERLGLPRREHRLRGTFHRRVGRE